MAVNYSMEKKSKHNKHNTWVKYIEYDFHRWKFFEHRCNNQLQKNYE